MTIAQFIVHIYENYNTWELQNRLQTENEAGGYFRWRLWYIYTRRQQKIVCKNKEITNHINLGMEIMHGSCWIGSNQSTKPMDIRKYMKSHKIGHGVRIIYRTNLWELCMGTVVPAPTTERSRPIYSAAALTHLHSATTSNNGLILFWFAWVPNLGMAVLDRITFPFLQKYNYQLFPSCIPLSLALHY